MVYSNNKHEEMQLAGKIIVLIVGLCCERNNAPHPNPLSFNFDKLGNQFSKK